MGSGGKKKKKTLSLFSFPPLSLSLSSIQSACSSFALLFPYTPTKKSENKTEGCLVRKDATGWGRAGEERKGEKK